MVIACFCFFEFAEDLFQRAFADALFCFGSDADLAAGGIFLDITFVAQVFDEIAHTIFLVGELRILYPAGSSS